MLSSEFEQNNSRLLKGVFSIDNRKEVDKNLQNLPLQDF
jgi:hypothetical protein